MKLLDVLIYETPVESNGEVKIPIPEGQYFVLKGGTFTTNVFKANQGPLPISVNHSDRTGNNIKVEVNADTITFTQGYRQELYIQLLALSNEDYVPSDQVTPKYIDTMTIKEVKFQRWGPATVVATFSNEKVRLTTQGFTPSASGLYVASVTTTNNKEYILPLVMNSHVATTDPTTYDYATIIIDRIIEVYQK